MEVYAAGGYTNIHLSSEEGHQLLASRHLK